MHVTHMAKTTEWISALDNSLKRVQQELGNHHQLICAVRTAGGNPAAQQVPVTREEKLRSALAKTIDTLEDTRKSFKSKRLEALRRELARVLIDVT